MDPDVPAGMGGFFPSMFGDLLRLLKTDSPIQWDLTVQFAQNVAAEGDPAPNVEPVDRIRLEELLRLAELQVADVAGMSTTPGGRPLTIAATGRAEWARRSLESWRPVIEQVAAALSPPANGTAPAVPAELDDEQGDLGDFLGQWTSAVAPAMLAMQVGSVVGHLAQRALGQYELPLPRRVDGELLALPANVASFAEDWSLPSDDLALWLLVQDVTVHAVLSRPHMRARLERLIVDQARGFRRNPKALEERLGEAAAGGVAADLSELSKLFGDPGAFGEHEDSPEMRRVQAELTALACVISGYAAWVTDVVASRLIGTHGTIREATRRRRVERGENERVAEALFGLRLDQETVDRGEAFIRGVVERGGDAELAKLWVVEADLPTPAEVDAPGLWIERVNLPPLDSAD